MMDWAWLYFLYGFAAACNAIYAAWMAVRWWRSRDEESKEVSRDV